MFCDSLSDQFLISTLFWVLKESKLQVDLCAEKVSLCKSIYADAMSRLEKISVSVHDTRRRQTMSSNQSSSPPSSLRGQGVGAESVESFVELSGPGSDVFSSSPRSNEKIIFPPESPLDIPVVFPSPRFGPLVNGLLRVGFYSLFYVAFFR